MKKINCNILNLSLSLSSIAFVSAIILSSCSKTNEKNHNAKDIENVYQASLVESENMETELTLPGELEGYYETGIVAKVNGYIKHLYVDIGDHVQRGQLLAELEAPELINQLTAAYAEYQAKAALYINTKGKFHRLIQTNKTSGAVSPYDMDLAKATLISDSLGLNAAKEKYESTKELSNYLRITAPFEGIITERALAPGSFVGPNDKQNSTLLKLKSEDNLRLHVAVPEKHIAEIKIGNTVKFHVKSFPDEIFAGKISRISRNVNIQTRSEVIEIEIKNNDGKLLPGMYAVAIIPLRREKPSVVVPASAVVTNMERSFVIKVNNKGEAAYVDVEKGEQKNGLVEVFGKLNSGDTVLNTGSDEIRNRSKVKIVLVGEDQINRSHITQAR